MLDKTLIITGGNTGSGYECAKSIAASGQGWRIVIAGRNQQRISEAAQRRDELVSNSQVAALPLDLASWETSARLVKLTREETLVCTPG